MKENKYYQPDISEFHIGFEYEVFDEENEVWSNKIFPEDFICTGTATEPDLVELFYSGLKDTRVKYLDRQDIEELGFSHYKMNIFKKDGITILHQKDNHLEIFDESDTLFSGRIKNKTELKKLLKQLKV